MDNSIKKKNEQLGMPFGTACNRLRKIVAFELVKKCGLDVCYQCNDKIKSVDELSIEHKVPYLDSEDPIKLFFDFDNIAFSHLKCNIGAARQTKILAHPSQQAYAEGCRCSGCTEENAKRVRNWRNKR